MTAITAPAGRNQAATALLLAAAMAATVGAALGFEHWGGYIPCHLCLEERTPYYVGAPLMLAASIAGLFRAPGWLARGLIALGGLLMLYGLALAIYHSGVEWHWWAGPANCSAVAGDIDTGGKGVLDAIDAVVPPACDRAAGRFLGLSFAGWNVLASAALAGVAFRGAFGRR